MSRGGAEREGDTESEAGSWLWAVSTEPDAGLKLMDHEIMTWAGRTRNQLSHPGAPALECLNWAVAPLQIWQEGASDTGREFWETWFVFEEGVITYEHRGQTLNQILATELSTM